jgi:hypothetical protein
MGILNDSFSGKNTRIKELKLTMCLPWFIGYVYIYGISACDLGGF